MGDRAFDRRWAPKAPESGGLIAAIKPYKTYIVLGVAMLAVIIAYQLYSRRASQKKEPSQIETGLKNIQGAIAQEERPKIEVDPQVIEVLQNQVLAYQAQVQEMDAALAQATQLLRQFGYGPSGQVGGSDPHNTQQQVQFSSQMPPVGAGAPTRGGGDQQPAMGAFAGGGQMGEPMPAIDGMSSQMGGMGF